MLGVRHAPEVRNGTERILLREIDSSSKSATATLIQLQEVLQLLATYQEIWVQLLGCRRSNLMSLIPLTSQRLDQLTATAKTLAGTLHAKINPLQQLLYRLEVFASVNASTAAELQQAAAPSQLVADKSALAHMEHQVLKDMERLVATFELHVMLAVTGKQQQQHQSPSLHTSAAPPAMLDSQAANLQLSHLQHGAIMAHDLQHKPQHPLQHHQLGHPQHGPTQQQHRQQQQRADPSQQELVHHPAVVDCNPVSGQPADLATVTTGSNLQPTHAQQQQQVKQLQNVAQQRALHHGSFGCRKTDAMSASGTIQQNPLVQRPNEGLLTHIHGWKARQQQQQQQHWSEQQQQPQTLQDDFGGPLDHAQQGFQGLQPGQASGQEPPCSEAAMGQDVMPAADSSARCGAAFGGSPPRRVHTQDSLPGAALS